MAESIVTPELTNNRGRTTIFIMAPSQRTATVLYSLPERYWLLTLAFAAQLIE